MFPSRKTRISVLLALLAAAIPCRAQSETDLGKWGQQPDGTFINPLMPADFSDLDAIRVGGDFYAISSTFQYSPGLVVLRSRDLVNWRIIGHVVDNVTSISPDMNWDRMARAGHGIWAGSIRFHNGRFFVYFGTPDEGIFMSSSADPSGHWDSLKKIIPESGWDDPCPFWDDDGQGYLVTTRYKADPVTGKTYNIHLFRLNAVGDSIDHDSDLIIHQSRGSEANKLYKIHGLYFHYFSEVRSEGRVPMIERASKLEGPWEIKQIGHVNPKVDKGPNQGGLIELPDHRWYFVTHQGTGDWEGRAGVLLPVTWIDNWPILGSPGPDGIGNMIWRDRAPLPLRGEASLVTSDDFHSRTLKPQGEWNYQPRSDAWSLTEQPGVLTLHAFEPLRTSQFNTVGNVLTQRAMRTAANRVTLKLLLTKMADGQRAGLAHYAKSDGELEVIQRHGERRIAVVIEHSETLGAKITGDTIWLRSEWDFEGQSHFSYSADGKTFTSFGALYQLTWGSYRGDRIGIFTFNDIDRKGSIGVLSFNYETAH
jgi:beta-xylosidase